MLYVSLVVCGAVFIHSSWKEAKKNNAYLENIQIASIQIASEVSDPSKMPRNGTGPFFGFEINLANEVRVGLYKTKHFRVHGADQGGIGQIFAVASNPQNKYVFNYVHLRTDNAGKTFYLTGETKVHQTN